MFHNNDDNNNNDNKTFCHSSEVGSFPYSFLELTEGALSQELPTFLLHKMVAFDYADFVFDRFVNVLVYYGLSLNISDFGMNIYLTQMIFGLVEMPARTITLFTLNRSRRISQLAFLAVGGLACLLTIFIPDGRWKNKPLLN